MTNNFPIDEETVGMDDRVLDFYHEQTGADIDDAQVERFKMHHSPGAVYAIEAEILFSGGTVVTYETNITEEFYEQFFVDDGDDGPERARRFELAWTEDEAEVHDTELLARGVAYPDGATHVQWNDLENEQLDSDVNGTSFNPAPTGLEKIKELDNFQAEFYWVDGEEADDE